MGKLTHIADIEKREEELKDEQEMLEAQERLAGSTAARQTVRTREPQPDASAVQPDANRQNGLRKAADGNRRQSEPHELSAEEELEFHGLNDKDSMGIGQGVLIAVAIVVFIVAVVYVANHILHFL